MPGAAVRPRAELVDAAPNPLIPDHPTMADHSEDFTIGVEEEYQIVDPRTRELRQKAGSVLKSARAVVGSEVSNELFESQIEIGTPVCRSLAEVRAELIRLRKALIAAAGRSGCAIAAAGTHPSSRWEDQSITPKDRYRGIADDFQQLAREQIIFGCHVHVGLADIEATIQVMNRVRPWLSALLALSANSPFWQGGDTGYSSYRTQLFQRFPTVNVPHVFASRAEYEDLLGSLVSTGIIEDGSKIYWDVRPSSHVETLEFRVADVCLTVDEAVMQAGLARSLVRTCLAQHERGEPITHERPELLQAAKWSAARHGLDGDLIDVHARRTVPAAHRVEGLLNFLRPDLEAHGEWAEIAGLAHATVDQGSGAARQRAIYAKTGRMEDVVDYIVAQTSRGVV